MTTKQQVDVEKLHQIFNKESCENDERNLLFVWTLIGIAQLNCEVCNCDQNLECLGTLLF